MAILEHGLKALRRRLPRAISALLSFLAGAACFVALGGALEREPPDLAAEIAAAEPAAPEVLQCLAAHPRDPAVRAELSEAALDAARSRGHRFDDRVAWRGALKTAVADAWDSGADGDPGRANLAFCQAALFGTGRDHDGREGLRWLIARQDERLLLLAPWPGSAAGEDLQPLRRQIALVRLLAREPGLGEAPARAGAGESSADWRAAELAAALRADLRGAIRGDAVDLSRFQVRAATVGGGELLFVSAGGDERVFTWRPGPGEAELLAPVGCQAGAERGVEVMRASWGDRMRAQTDQQATCRYVREVRGGGG